jgi:microcystin-dependent protein
MGGASANVVTDTEADTIGDVGGDEEETQTLSTLVNHDHNSFNDNAGAITAGGGIGQAGLSDATGGGAAMNIMNPYLTINLFIRY